MLHVNVAQGMLSQCRSAKSALIRARLFCVPPVASAPGGVLLAALLPIPSTVTPGAAEMAVPWKLTVAPGACAGAKSMNTVGLVILSADIAMPPG